MFSMVVTNFVKHFLSHFDHYKYMSMKFPEIFKATKMENFHLKNFGIFSSPELLGSQGELIGWP